MHSAPLSSQDDRDDLTSFALPDETAAALLSRAHVESLLSHIPFIDEHVPLKPGKVLEFAGPSSSGKTELLIQLCVTCVMPKDYGGVAFGGWEGVAIYIDLDARFDPMRLQQVLEFRMKSAIQAQKGVDDLPVELCESCLSRFHLIQCHSGFQFLATLKLLPSTLKQLEAYGPIKLISIDNILSYYWLDRGNRAPMSHNELAPSLKLPLTVQRVHCAVYNELVSILGNNQVLLAITKHASVTVKIKEGGEDGSEASELWEHKEMLIPDLQRLLKNRLLLMPTDQLPDEMQRRKMMGHRPGEIAAKWVVPSCDWTAMIRISKGTLNCGIMD